MLAMFLILLMSFPGCLMVPSDFADDIFYDTDQFWLNYSLANWEMANEYVKNPNNETTSETLHELEVNFSASTSYVPEIWIDHFWIAHNDVSYSNVVEADENQSMFYTPPGYGAFDLRFGMVLNTESVYWQGHPLENNSLADYAPFIRSAWFEFEENRATEFSELYVDGPHESSLGPPEAIIVESTVSNVIDLGFESVDVTWSIYGPGNELMMNHTETIGYRDSFTLDLFIDENIPFGDIIMEIEGDGEATLSHSTRLKMSYSGFLCDSETSRNCPR